MAISQGGRPTRRACPSRARRPTGALSASSSSMSPSKLLITISNFCATTSCLSVCLPVCLFICLTGFPPAPDVPFRPHSARMAARSKLRAVRSRPVLWTPIGRLPPSDLARCSVRSPSARSHLMPSSWPSIRPSPRTLSALSAFAAPNSRLTMISPHQPPPPPSPNLARLSDHRLGPTSHLVVNCGRRCGSRLKNLQICSLHLQLLNYLLAVIAPALLFAIGA